MSCAAVLRAALDPNLTALDVRALAIVAGLDGAPMARAEIARIAKCALMSVPRILRKLESHGYLARQSAPGKPNSYALGGNLHVTGNRSEGGNLHVTPCISAKKINRPTKASGGGNLHVTGNSKQPPPPQKENSPTPPIRKTTPYPPASRLEFNPDSVSPSLEGGPGGFLLEAEPFEPEPKRRSAFRLDEPMTNAQREVAAKYGFLNGTGEALFERCKSHHAARGTLFADKTAAFRTWVLHEIEYSEKRNGKPTGAHAARPATAAECERLATESRRRGFAAALARHERGLREEPQHMAGEADGDGSARASGRRLAIIDASGPAQNRGGG